MTFHTPLFKNQYRNWDSPFPFDIIISEVKEHYPNHRHGFLEFSYVIEGEGSEVINGDEHPLRPGIFTFLLPYQYHEIRSKLGHSLRLYSCAIGMNIVMGQHETGHGLEVLLQSDPSLQPFVQFTGDGQKEMDQLFHRLMQEYKRNGSWSKVVLRGMILEILVLFDRSRRSNVDDRSNPSSLIMWKIIDYIHSHYNEPLSLHQIAEQFHISAPYLSKLFKKNIGENFLSFVHDLRIRHACSLLASTKLSIIEVAFEVGFGSYSSFLRVFQEKQGMNPTEYLNSLTARVQL